MLLQFQISWFKIINYMSCLSHTVLYTLLLRSKALNTCLCSDLRLKTFFPYNEWKLSWYQLNIQISLEKRSRGFHKKVIFFLLEKKRKLTNHIKPEWKLKDPKRIWKAFWLQNLWNYQTEVDILHNLFEGHSASIETSELEGSLALFLPPALDEAAPEVEDGWPAMSQSQSDGEPLQDSQS